MNRTLVTTLSILLLAAGFSLAQYEPWHAPDVRTAREAGQHATETPRWTNPPRHSRDVFTFVRIRYGRNPEARRSAGHWAIDFPDSDLNLSFRLQQMTSLKVDPDGRVLQITDPELFHYPWIYMVEPGGLMLTEEEIPLLRRYLLSGGFLMVDDFWGETEWAGFEEQMRRVFPERDWKELGLDHPVYQMPFHITSKGQVPNVYTGTRSQYTGVTWERFDASEVHHRAWFDDKGRMMVIACHNTDNGDGWEREGENEYYFREFSEKIAYPLGINIIFYAMTH